MYMCVKGPVGKALGAGLGFMLSEVPGDEGQEK